MTNATSTLDRAIVTPADADAVAETKRNAGTKRGQATRNAKPAQGKPAAKVRTVAQITRAFASSESSASKFEDKVLEFRVTASRQYFELASHPTIRNKNGTPNKAAASRALGKANPSSHRLYWDAAEALRKAGRLDAKDVSAADLALARDIWQGKAETSKANRDAGKGGKGKGKGKGEGGKGKGETILPSVASINGALDAVAHLIGEFYKDAAFTDDERDALAERLQNLALLVESNGAADDDADDDDAE